MSWKVSPCGKWQEWNVFWRAPRDEAKKLRVGTARSKKSVSEGLSAEEKECVSMCVRTWAYVGM